MSAKRISMKDMPEVSRKECAARILQARDNVGRAARSNITGALANWRSVAPYGKGKRGGHMRDGVSIESSVGQARLEVPDGDIFYRINSVNKYGKHAGFYDAFKREQGSRFYRTAIAAAKKALH